MKAKHDDGDLGEYCVFAWRTTRAGSQRESGWMEQTPQARRAARTEVMLAAGR